MAKKIVWSKTAQNDRLEIFSYWKNRTRSTAYSRKLNTLFNEAISMIARFPKMGKQVGYKEVRIKVVRDYLVVYKEFPGFIAIITIWDARQDPGKLHKLLE